MFNPKLALSSVAIWFLFGCVATPQFMHTGNTTTMEFSPTLKESIDIYRSTFPPWKYSEIGILTLRGVSDINMIFDLFRIEAAKRGANAIVKFDLNSESKVITVARLETDHDGNTTWVYEDERVVAYTASCTLVRKIREE